MRAQPRQHLCSSTFDRSLRWIPPGGKHVGFDGRTCGGRGESGRLGVKRAELTAIHRRFAKVFLGSFEIDESVKLKRPPGRFSLSLSSFFQTVFPDTWKLAGYAEQGWSCRLFDYLPINHRCTLTKNSFGGTRNGRSNRFVAAGYFARRRSCRAADLPISP